MKHPLILASFGLATLAGVAPAIAAAPMNRPADAKTCIDVSRIGHETAESKDVVIFHMTNGQAYRNHLISTCPGLMNINGFWRVETEPTGSQLCHGDRIRPFDPQSVRTTGMRSFPACGLGYFEPAPDLARKHRNK